MLYDPATAPQLKPWLVRTLEPICDAEPGALADYILALLKHNAPEHEMRQELAVQLDEFLEKECPGFIDTLFTVLRTKSYMPYVAGSDSPPLQVTPLGDPAEGIPIPLDGLLTPSSERPQSQQRMKRRNTAEDDVRPHKGPRLNNDGSFQRFGEGTGQGWIGRQGFGVARNGPMPPFGMHMNGMGMNGRPPLGYQPPDQKRGICRDYHNNGYCARGSMCKYSHGEDAVVPGQLYPGSGMPFIPLFPGNMPFIQGAAYDPHEAHMDMRPRHQRAPLLPRIQHEDGSVVHPVAASGELPVIQDLTPNIPTPNIPSPPPVPTEEPLPSGDHEMQNPTSGMVPLGGIGAFNPIPGPPLMNGHQLPMANGPLDFDPNVAAALRPQTQSRGFRGRGRGGRGTFGAEVHSFRPEKRQDRTLVVEKIPEDKLSLDQVNEWFKRFGIVTNVAIDAAGGKALVSFEKHEEAHAAWRSEEAVFGNRFVKVFWHRPLDGHGQVGARMLAASAPLVANMVSKDKAAAGPSSISIATTNSAPTVAAAAAAAATSTSTSNVAARKVPSTHSGSSTATALAAKQQLLEQKIAEQKTLMTSLEKASAEEKKEIMARWRKLNEEMTQLTSTSSTADTSKTPTTNGSISKAEQEKKEKERLDKELDMHHKADEPSTTTEELKAKLEKLKAEAASLGLDSALSSTTVSRGGYRGRPPRGRGYFRGIPMRGGPPRASMKLDNRPKRLLVKGVVEEKVQALRDWYETTSQLDGVEHAEDVADAYIVSFKSRSGAEQGLAKGSNVPTVGSVQITWYTGKGSTNGVPIPGTGSSSSIPVTAMKKSGVSTSTNGGVLGAGGTESHVGDGSPVHPLQEEEIVASGWGVDGDEGDGMGML